MAADKEGPKRTPSNKPARSERLASALRANLKRRKEAARDRTCAPGSAEIAQESGVKPRR